MSGVDILKKLVPLAPWNRVRLAQVGGVFAPTSRLRAKEVPAPPPVLSSSSATPVNAQATPKLASKPAAARSTCRLDQAVLLKRVFAVDVTLCARGEGSMRVIACIEEPSVVTRILRHLGLSAVPLPTARAQAPPVDLELFSDP